MWDGDGCPCETFELDRESLPMSGVFTIETPIEPRDCGRCDGTGTVYVRLYEQTVGCGMCRGTGKEPE